ncbi:MAG: CHAT domain-containing protein [Bacteroidales bacterium]|nr:CHAT domain-containing protein [Bacteroidales bacterium]
MTRRLSLILLLLVLQPLMIVAQDTDKLFADGNNCYVNSGNKAELKRIIQEYMDALKANPDESLQKLQLYKLLGDYYYLNSDEDSESYARAEYYFKQSLAFAEDPAHSSYQTVYHDRFVLHHELAQLYYKQKLYSKAFMEMQTAFMLASNYLSPYDDLVLDFAGQLAICRARVAASEDDFKEALDLIDDVIENYRNVDSERYGEALRKKAKILMLRQESGFGSAGDALDYYKQYYQIKKADVLKRFACMNADDREHCWMLMRAFVTDCYRTEDTDPGFLYDVTLFVKAFLLEYQLNIKPQLYTWKTIRNKLGPSDCAIEFVQYEKYGAKQMGALVLKHHGQPCFVKLGSVDSMINSPLLQGGTVETAITVDSRQLKDNLYSDTAIFAKVWTPELLQTIGADTKTIYFAADGIFHQMAIEYMLTGYDTHRLTSTRQLAMAPSEKKDHNVLIVGDVDYNNIGGDDVGSVYENDTVAYQYLKSMNVWVSSLPGTKNEIDSIVVMLEKQNATVETVSGANATEPYVTHMLGKSQIIHIATHGYYIGMMPAGTDLHPATYDESLSQNGLILAGANTTLQADDFNTSLYDGVLSARELSQLDLSGTELVVLSACHSGQGYLTADGIYGMQRGLKKAGVKAMIISLWSVDDKATAYLMQAFYSYLKTNDIHTAFKLARQKLMQMPDNGGRHFDKSRLTRRKTANHFDRPQYYDAFILIE